MLVAWIATKGMLSFLARVSDPVKAAVEAFGRAQEAATPDKQAALRAWMRGIILLGRRAIKTLKSARVTRKRALWPDCSHQGASAYDPHGSRGYTNHDVLRSHG